MERCTGPRIRVLINTCYKPRFAATDPISIPFEEKNFCWLMSLVFVQLCEGILSLASRIIPSARKESTFPGFRSKLHANLPVMGLVNVTGRLLFAFLFLSRCG